MANRVISEHVLSCTQSFSIFQRGAFSLEHYYYLYRFSANVYTCVFVCVYEHHHRI